MSSVNDTMTESGPAVITNTEFVIWHLLYYGLATVAFFLNLIIIVLTLTFSYLRHRTFGAFASSISFAYMLQCAFFIPFLFRPKLLGGAYDPMGAPWICQLAPWTLDVAYHVEALSLIVIASIVIARIRRNDSVAIDLQIRPRLTFLFIGLIWAFSIIISYPWAYYRKVLPKGGQESNSDPTVYTCQKPKEDWYAHYQNYVSYGGSALAVIIAVVLFIVAGIKLRNPRVKILREAKTELKASAGFLIKQCLVWLPTGIIILISYTKPSLLSNKTYPHLLTLINRWVYNTAALWNPIIMLAILPWYRAALTCLFCCKHPSYLEGALASQGVKKGSSGSRPTATESTSYGFFAGAAGVTPSDSGAHLFNSQAAYNIDYSASAGALSPNSIYAAPALVWAFSPYYAAPNGLQQAQSFAGHQGLTHARAPTARSDGGPWPPLPVFTSTVFPPTGGIYGSSKPVNSTIYDQRPNYGYYNYYA